VLHDPLGQHLAGIIRRVLQQLPAALDRVAGLGRISSLPGPARWATLGVVSTERGLTTSVGLAPMATDTVRLFLYILVALVIGGSAFGADVFGKYVGRVVTEWVEDARKMKLLEDFAYIDPSGNRWEAPKGSIVDGASIPQLAWSFIGGPFEGQYRNASVIHDVACDERKRYWEDVHWAFYTGMLASGVGKIKAKIMYAAVYHFGPRWPVVVVTYKEVVTGGKVPIKKRTVYPPVPKLQEADFGRLVSSIQNRESSGSPMTLGEIRQFN